MNQTKKPVNLIVAAYLEKLAKLIREGKLRGLEIRWADEAVEAAVVPAEPGSFVSAEEYAPDPGDDWESVAPLPRIVS